MHNETHYLYCSVNTTHIPILIYLSYTSYTYHIPTHIPIYIYTGTEKQRINVFTYNKSKDTEIPLDTKNS